MSNHAKHTMPSLPDNIDSQVKQALSEDIGSGDVTAALIPSTKMAEAKVICREQAVICGKAWFSEVFKQLDSDIELNWEVNDGDIVAADTPLVTLRGNARSILSGERAALNFLQTLSGVASKSAALAALVDGTNCTILDTRKTIPGLRLAQKYAVACGGCRNHRIGLYDAILIKENHIISAGSIEAAVETARKLYPNLLLEVETENLAEFHQALAAQVDVIMLDEFSLDDIHQAVAITAAFNAEDNGEDKNHTTKLEVSGNITPETIPTYAATGVDFISTGSLTKHVRAVDLSMRFNFSD